VAVVEKLAFSNPFAREEDNTARNLAVGGGLLGTALGAGSYALRKPGIRAALGHAFPGVVEARNAIMQPGRKAVLDQVLEQSTGVHEAARMEIERQAKFIAEQMQAAGLDPKAARIAIAGLGGSGKGTLARALKEQLGIDAVELDDLTKGMRPFTNTLEEALGTPETTKLRRGMMYDQKRVTTELDPDIFDAVIKLKRDPERIKQQLYGRGRGAWQADLMDMDRSQAVLDRSFDLSRGNALEVGDGVALKLRPQEGFGLREALDADLATKGVRPDGMSQLQKLQKSVDPKRLALNGVAGEFKLDELGQAAGATLGGGALLGTAGYMAGA